MQKTLIYSLIFFTAFTLAASAETQRENRERQGKEFLKNAPNTIKDLGKRVSEEVRELKMKSLENIKAEREKFQKEFNEKREILKNKISEERSTFKQKLKTTVRDEKKKMKVERIDNQLGALNEKMLHQFTEHLNKLDSVLERIQERSEKAKEKGADVATVLTAIATAHSAISDARTLITTQAGKTYTIAVQGEETLKSDVGMARNLLHSDLSNVKEAIRDANEKVHAAAEEFGKISKEFRTEETRSNEN